MAHTTHRDQDENGHTDRHIGTREVMRGEYWRLEVYRLIPDAILPFCHSVQ